MKVDSRDLQAESTEFTGSVVFSGQNIPTEDEKYSQAGLCQTPVNNQQ